MPNAEAELKDAFSSPARLMQTLRDKVADPESLFYCPGSLLNNEFDPNNPMAWGMPASWPVFFEDDQAYRCAPVSASISVTFPGYSSEWLNRSDTSSLTVAGPRRNCTGFPVMPSWAPKAKCHPNISDWRPPFRARTRAGGPSEGDARPRP